MKRKIYLDNLRWFVVILVLIYHVCYIFNGVGIFGGIPNAKNIEFFDGFMYIVYPWFMVLLFVVAGMSARYSLQKRSNKEFLKERVTKLLVPSTLGLFVLHWISGYINIKMGLGLSQIPTFIYPISALSGIGPLWFIQMLFIFSVAIVLLKKSDKSDFLWKLGGKSDVFVIFLLFFVIWGGAQIGNMPVVTTYRFGIYFVAFLIGYYIFSHEKVEKILEKISIPTSILAIILSVFYVYFYFGKNFTESEILQNFATNLYCWITVIAMIGIFKKYFNLENSFTKHMTKTSFGIYILHYFVLVIVGYVLVNYFDLPAIWNYFLAFVLIFAGTFGLLEIISKIPIIRYLVLGIKKK
ncbi:hypothetical protein BKN14_00705 [Candidatus Gracilibacteria bacterium HOT-871]|nr:hypothetical protein BKN14_00705 [Candidatus Gracilibacteria bacterium HOT-871]